MPQSASAPTLPASKATRTLAAGSVAPPFALHANDLGTCALAELVAEGPAVLIFYRGDW